MARDRALFCLGGLLYPLAQWTAEREWLMRVVMRSLILVAALAGDVHAQDIAGTWQGTIALDAQEFRQIFRISKAGAGWQIVYYDLDAAPDPVIATKVDVDRSMLKVAFPPMAPPRQVPATRARSAPMLIQSLAPGSARRPARADPSPGHGQGSMARSITPHRPLHRSRHKR